MSYVIIDLDNCIADDAWRIPHIHWQKSNPMERYHDYHSLSAYDQAGNSFLYDNAQGEVIVFTARPVLYAPITHEWLRRNGVNAKHVIMRNNNDHRSSLELKRHMLHWLPELYGVTWSEISAAYDDRPDIVEMYRKHGIWAHECRIHDACAYTPPVQDVHTVTVSS